MKGMRHRLAGFGEAGRPRGACAERGLRNGFVVVTGRAESASNEGERPASMIALVRRFALVASLAILIASSAFADRAVPLSTVAGLGVHSDGTGTWGTLVKGLGNPNPRTRIAVVESLSEVRLPQNTAALIGALNDPDPGVRIAARNAIRVRMSGQTLKMLVEGAKEANGHGVREISGALAEYEAAANLALLVASLGDASERVRVVVVQAMGASGESPFFWPLVRALRDVAPNVRYEAALALAAFGGPRFGPELTRLLRHSEPMVREGAATALGRAGNKAAVPPLRKALRDPSLRVRMAVQEALRILSGQPPEPETGSLRLA